jgi:hypothetical protein
MGKFLEISKKFTNENFKDDAYVATSGLDLLQRIVETEDRDKLYSLAFNNVKLSCNYIEVFNYAFGPNSWTQELGKHGVKYPLNLVTADPKDWAFPVSDRFLNKYLRVFQNTFSQKQDLMNL